MLTSHGIKNPKILIYDGQANTIIFAASYNNRIYYKDDQQQFASSSLSIFQLKLATGSKPKRIELSSSDDDLTSFTVEQLENAVAVLFSKTSTEQAPSDGLFFNRDASTNRQPVLIQSNELQLTITNDAVHQNLLTIDYESEADVLFKIERESELTGFTDIFWLEGSHFTDYKMGLRPGNNTYRVYVCEVSMICEETPAATQSIATQAFFENNDWSVNVSESDASYSSELQGTIANANWPSADFLRVHLLHKKAKYVVQNQSYSFKIDVDNNNLLVGVQPCMSSSIENLPYVCAEFTTSKSISLPVKPTIVPLLAPDYSYIAVHFEEEENVLYSIERSLEDHSFLPIASDTESGWRDTDVRPGSLYTYRVIACDQANSVCRTSNSKSVELNRRNSISGFSSARSGYIELSLRNYLDYDEIAISREDGAGDFHKIASIAPHVSNFIDSDIIPGADYRYLIEMLLDGEAVEQIYLTESYPEPRTFVPMAAEEEIRLRIDENYSLGHFLTWNDVENATSWAVRAATNRYNVDTVFIEKTDTPSYFYSYAQQTDKTPYLEYQIIPIFNDCIIEQYDCSSQYGFSTFIKSGPLSISLTDKALFPAEFNLQQTSLNTVTLDIKTTFVTDSYRIERKNSNEQSWEVISFEEVDNYFNDLVVIDDATHLIAGDTYQYRITACSSLLKTCTTSQVQSVTYNGEQYQGKALTPSINYQNNRFNIDLHFPPDYYISFAEIAASWRNHHQTWRTENVAEPIEIAQQNYMEEGDDISFTVRYCFHALNTSQSEDCSEHSNNVIINIEGENRHYPPQISTLSNTVISSESAIRVSGHFRDGEGVGRPDSIEIYKATNDGPHRSIAAIEIDDASGTDFEYMDTDITYGNYYQYGARACNQYGCDEDLKYTLYYAAPDTNDGQQKPSFKTISDGEFIDQIAIEVGDELSTQPIISLFRAESEEGDFQYVDSLWNTYFFTDRDLEANTTYFYRLEACISGICTTSDIGQGRTASAFNTDPIEISGELLLEARNNHKGLVTLSGHVEAMDGILDAAVGELRFNQWFYINEGWQLSTHARLDAGWAECESLLDFSLFLSGAEHTSTEHTNTFASIYFTGNGCSEFPNLELFKLYFISDYFDAPLPLDDKFKEVWTDYSVQFDSAGFFTFYIADELLATADSQLDLSVYGLSKLKLGTNDPYQGATHLSSVSIDIAATPSLTQQSLVSYYSPELEELHARNIAIALSENFSGSLQYITAEGSNLGTVNNLIVSSGGRYNTYIEDLLPNKSYEFLLRRCHQEICGPYEYRKISTPSYSQISYMPYIATALNEQDYSVDITMYSDYYIEIIDTFTLYRQIEGIDETPVIFAQFTTEDLMNYWLAHDDHYLLSDTLEYHQSASYVLEACNPIGCKTDTNNTTFTMPGDADNDGVLDPYDAFPNDPNETMDTDGDGVGNNADEDDDGDTIPDLLEVSLGLDPLNRYDAYVDLDDDGFSNAFEYVTGADLNDPNITPEQFEIFESFSSGTSRFVNIYGEHTSSDNSIDGNSSIRSWLRFGSESSITFSITGKLMDGYFVFTELYDYRTEFSLKIDDVNVDFSTSRVKHLASNGNWQSLGIPVEATDQEVTVELKFELHEYYYSGEVYIDNIFIPMTDAKLVNRSVADYDGDGKTDVAIRRGFLGTNYVLNSSDNEIQRIQFGSKEEDIQIEGDFDGDGIADVAVRRPSTGTWYVKNSSGSNLGSAREDGIQRIEFGAKEDDIPVAADYDGDGITDFAVRRASNSMWYIKNSSGSNYNSAREDGIQRVQFGLQEADIPVPADYDGDGISDIAFRRPSNSTWYILESSSGEIQRIKFGLQETDIPVPADYDGDGKADVAFRRPSNKTWYVLRSSDEVIERIQFGLNTADIPVVGDYDGDGKADIAVRRESNSMWYILQSSDGEIGRVNFGKSDGMVPVLAPVWEKLNMLGWQQDFIDATLAGRDSAAASEDEEVFYEKAEFFTHPELIEADRLNQEPMH
ncbi:FG-GAP-like repeat-containing protein [Planctobacterium marinum]|uniref:FG-GAP-like repeat-containing protein n=1 Tax=Planctobacterium marinum TaxID=1631968 RepID=UPI0030C734BE